MFILVLIPHKLFCNYSKLSGSGVQRPVNG
jgi:hypothetical protein